MKLKQMNSMWNSSDQSFDRVKKKFLVLIRNGAHLLHGKDRILIETDQSRVIVSSSLFPQPLLLPTKLYGLIKKQYNLRTLHLRT